MSLADLTSRPVRRALRVAEALAGPHGLDRYLELVHPMLTVHELRAEITDVHRATADSVTLTLRPNRLWRGFSAGQFVEVTVEVDGVRRTRCYSPANSEHRADGRFELTVKAHADGLVSRHLYAHVRPGTVLGLSQAAGAFRLPAARPVRTLLISGGSGITPVLSMVRTLVDERHTGEVVLLHYASAAADVPYLGELRRLEATAPNVRVVFAYTRQPDGGDLAGRFDGSHLSEVAPRYAEAETYLCGPSGLMASVREHYAAAGLEHQLHTEEFVLVPAGAPASPGSGSVRFTRSGTTVANSGASLLVQAEEAGLTPDYGCRMGICFTCTRVKKSGYTRNVRTGETHGEPDTEIQLCVSAPVGDVDIDL